MTDQEQIDEAAKAENSQAGVEVDSTQPGNVEPAKDNQESDTAEGQ